MQSYVEHTFQPFIDIRGIQLAETVPVYQSLKWNLIIEEIEAENLIIKNPKEGCNPFVRLYVSSNDTEKRDSSVSYQTLNPKYNESFSLPIPTEESINEDILVLKVLNRKERKSLMKFKKVNKDYEDDLIGVAKVPLKTIPPAGITAWYNLEKNYEKVMSQGMIKIKAKRIAQRGDHVCDANQEYCHLLKLLLYRELMDSQVAAYWWNGNFDVISRKLILHHQLQSALSDVEDAFAQWTVYSEVHQHHPLSFELFEKILRVLIPEIQNNDIINRKNIEIFWTKAQYVLASCFDSILLLRNREAESNCIATKQLTQTLKLIDILTNVSKLKPPEKFDIFEISYYDWLMDKNDGLPDFSLFDVIFQVVIRTVESYLDKIKIMTNDSILEYDELVNQELSQCCEIMRLASSADDSKILIDAVWLAISNIMTEVVELSLFKQRPPLFYHRIKSILAVMVEKSIEGLEQSAISSVETSLQSINKQLILCCKTSSELVHEFHMECHAAQRKIKASQLSVRAGFTIGNTLEIEIVEAAHLKAKDDNLCDPFVKIHFAPEEVFERDDKGEKILHPKTKVKEKSQFPEWKEKFSM